MARRLRSDDRAVAVSLHEPSGCRGILATAVVGLLFWAAMIAALLVGGRWHGG